MIYLNIYGSSHVSKHQGLQSSVRRTFESMDGLFRTKFSLNTIIGVPGATYYKSNVVQKFVQNSAQLACNEDYRGQINIVVLGQFFLQYLFTKCFA